MAGINGSTLVTAIVAAALGAGGAMVATRSSAAPNAVTGPRTADGKPDFSGVWQTLNEAHWDLQAHEARPAIVTQRGVYDYEYARVPAAPVLALGAAGGVPGSLGVVQGDGQIPYTPEALAVKQQNAENWIDRDPELKCYLPGIPRAMYMPYPFTIVQGTDKIHMTFAFSNAARVVHMNKVEGPPDDTYMGHSVGRWEGDALVVEVTNFNGRNWLDRAGNFHSDSLHLTERFTPISADATRSRRAGSSTRSARNRSHSCTTASARGSWRRTEPGSRSSWSASSASVCSMLWKPSCSASASTARSRRIARLVACWCSA